MSASFLRALTGSHTMATSCRIASQASPPVLGVEAQIISGSVTLDGTAAIRGSLDMVIAGRWPTPADLDAGGQVDGSALVPTPYGVQVQVSRGIQAASGVTELVTLGTFVVTTIEQVGTRATPEIHVTGQDRATLVAETGVVNTLQFPADATWEGMVTSVLAGASSSLTSRWDDPVAGSAPIGTQLVLEQGSGGAADRWSFILQSLQALGMIAWFDADGACRVGTIPNPGVSVWTVAAGEGGVMVRSGRTMRRDGQANGVLAVGETVTTARGTAYDVGPTSRTQWGDAYGRRLKVITSPLITTAEQGATAAVAELRRTIGLPYVLDLSAVPNPALEPGDVLSVQHSDTDIELHQIDSVTIPLVATDPVTTRTRETSTVVLGV